MRLTALTILVAIFSITFAACGDDADVKNGVNGQTSGNNGTTNNSSSTSNNGTTNNSSSTSNNGTTNNSSSTTNNTTTETCDLPEPSIDAVDSCDEGGYESCGWNGDCADTERCQDIGNVQNSGVTCCITACRGEKDLGEECTSVDECNSGSCIGRNPDPNVCSRPCESQADCPGSLECVAIPFLEYPMWCVTPRSE